MGVPITLFPLVPLSDHTIGSILSYILQPLKLEINCDLCLGEFSLLHSHVCWSCSGPQTRSLSCLVGLISRPMFPASPLSPPSNFYPASRRDLISPSVSQKSQRMCTRVSMFGANSQTIRFAPLLVTGKARLLSYYSPMMSSRC